MLLLNLVSSFIHQSLSSLEFAVTQAHRLPELDVFHDKRLNRLLHVAPALQQVERHFSQLLNACAIFQSFLLYGKREFTL